MKFNKYLNTYDNHAHVQKLVAKKLISFFEENKYYYNILEIGCGTGIFTKLLVQNISYKKLDLNDIFNSKDYLKNINYENFYEKDMDEMSLDRYSLVVSSSVFQWSKDLSILLDKIGDLTESLIFSIYTYGNLIEIEKHFGVTLKYFSEDEIYFMLKRKFKNIEKITEEIKLKFDTPMEALRHLKYTGVTGLTNKATILKVKSFSCIELTYVVSYFKCEK